MANTYTVLLYHIIFSTKSRQPTLTPEVREKLFPYMAGIINQHQGKALIINGVSDHVHILCSMKSTPDLAKFIKNIKGSSSSWHNAESRLNPIYWQEGYGAFTVSWSQQNRVFKYIENQENHHRRKSFAEEYERFLIKCGVEYDPRYFLD